MTPSSAMEARSRSAEVSSKGDLWGLVVGLHRLRQLEDGHFLISLCLSLPICEIEIATVPIL